jgi:hypothetical protein
VDSAPSVGVPPPPPPSSLLASHQIEAAMTRLAMFLASSSTPVLVLCGVVFLLVMLCLEPLVGCACAVCRSRAVRRWRE